MVLCCSTIVHWIYFDAGKIMEHCCLHPQSLLLTWPSPGWCGRRGVKMPAVGQLVTEVSSTTTPQQHFLHHSNNTAAQEARRLMVH